MPIHKLFAYGTLINPSVFHRVTNNARIISMKPAYTEGKMYSAGGFPLVLRLDDYKRRKAPWFVYGALIEFEAPDEVWLGLDGYEGCSKASLGENRKTDMYHREEVTVHVIKFDTFKDFTEFNFEVKEEEKAQIYFANVDSNLVQNALKHQKRAGNVWRSFFNIPIDGLS